VCRGGDGVRSVESGREYPVMATVASVDPPSIDPDLRTGSVQARRRFAWQGTIAAMPGPDGSVGGRRRGAGLGLILG
jgi:hypothetical protein